MTRPEFASGDGPRGGMLLPRAADLPPVPLEHTEISASVVGPLAEVTVRQRFRSAHSAPLDALYVFPLPQDAAVHELELRVGERLIRGELQERAAARQRFDEAASRGADAALLSQERPNLFSIELANLQPGEVVEVRLRFSNRVPFDDGAFTLSLPTVATPRYMPQGHDQADRAGATPLLPPGAPGHTLGLIVALDSGKLAELASPSHEIDIKNERGRQLISLRDGTALPDRDFVLRYRPAGELYSTAAMSYRAAGQPGALLLMLTPHGLPAPEQLLPRELLFVIDRSGSMSGEPIAQARNALRACLRALNPGDTFNIFPFSSDVTRLAPASLPFTQAAVDKADAYIAGIQAGGGTEILGALGAALDQPADPQRLRVIVFLTDGAVGNEEAVLRELSGRLGSSRVFAFGIGSAVNRYLLDKLAELGRGSVEYVLNGEPIEPAVQRFQGRAAQPLIRDITVDWAGARVADVLPDPIPDLYAGQPLTLLARFHAPRDERALVRVSGRTARGTYNETIELELPAATPDRGGPWALLPALWARARLDQLLSEIRRRGSGKAQALEDEARSLALQHDLLSPYTAFVAVEEPPPAAEGRRASERVVVPIHLPAGTLREGFEPPAPPPALGVFHSMAPVAASPRAMRASRPKTSSGMAARFLDALLRDGGATDEAAPAEMAPSAMYAGAALPAAPSAAQPRPADTPTDRRDAALRFLARTQAVDGAWAGDELATALALAAFARAGHSERAGDFRPQLARAARWLAARPAADPPALLARLADALAGSPALAGALRSADPAAIRAALDPLQRRGGDVDGAVPAPGANLARPDALSLALTAALAWATAG